MLRKPAQAAPPISAFPTRVLPGLRPLARVIPLAFAGAVLATSGWQPQAHAQTAATHRQDAMATHTYDIPGGPLSTVLAQFASESGVLVAAAGDLAQGKRSPGLRGSYGPQAALEALLAGTGLTVVAGPGQTYEIRLASASERQVAQLANITVKATQREDITEGTGSYTTRSTASATGLSLSLRETPQSVSVITRQQMDDQGLTDVASVLERSTGLTRNQPESDRIYFSVRGFDVTKVQYDGLPSREYFDYDSDVLADVSIYDRVEIVRGATGLVSGTGEPSAAINFVRKRPTTEFQGHVQLGAGSWDTYRGEVDLSGPLNAEGSIRGRLVAAHGRRHSYLDHYDRNVNALYGVVELDLPADTLLTLGLDYERNHTRGLTYGAPVPFFYADGSRTDFSRSTSTATDWTTLKRQRLATFVSLDKDLGNGWDVKFNYSHRISDGSPKLLYISGYPDRATGAGVYAFNSSYDIDHRAQALDLQVSGPFTLWGREHELVAGLAYYQRNLDYKWHPVLSSETLNSFYDRYDYPEPVFGDGYNRLRDQETREKSAYLTSRWHIADPLRLILGARLTTADYDQTFGGISISSRYRGELTPYAGLVYDFARNYSAYVSYTDIFETQTSRDRSGALLPPRTGSNYEAGIKGELLESRLNLAAAIFTMKQNNLAEFDTVVDGENRYRAIQGATVRGYELEANGEILPGWNVAIGYTYHDAKAPSGEPLQTLVPKNLLRLTSAYKLQGALSPVTVGGHITWQSRISENGVGPNGEDAVQDKYTLVHLFASYEASKHLSLHLTVNNIFDKTFYTSFVDGYGRYGEPRNVNLSMKYQF